MPPLTLKPLRVTSIQFLLTTSSLNHILRSWEYRKWSTITEALDRQANSPCQHLWKCIENSMENVHTDVRVERVKTSFRRLFSLPAGCHVWVVPSGPFSRYNCLLHHWQLLMERVIGNSVLCNSGKWFEYYLHLCCSGHGLKEAKGKKKSSTPPWKSKGGDRCVAYEQCTLYQFILQLFFLSSIGLIIPTPLLCE